MLQNARRSSSRAPAVAPEAERRPHVAPFGERGNEARLERMGPHRANLNRRLGLLEHASGAFGDLDEADAERLAALNEQLSGARELLAEGNLEALQGMVSDLDSNYGSLVAETGTIIDMPARGPSDAEPGEFDNVDSYYVNGMTNTLTQSMGHAAELAQVRGTDVGLVYNNTQGTMRDLGQSTAQKAASLLPFWEHRSTEGETLANAVDGSLDAGREVDIVSHSQGGYFAREAVERLDETEADQQRLDERLHLTQMGSPLEDDSLPDHFDNVTFIDENSDPVAREIGRRTGDQDQSWWDRLPIIGHDNRVDGQGGHLEFESGAVGFDAHRPMTYLQNHTVRNHLAHNPLDVMNGRDEGAGGGGGGGAP